MTPLDVLLEGFGSAVLPTTLTLLVPGFALALAARAAAVPGIAAFAVATLALSWLRFSGQGGGFPTLVIAAALIASVVVTMTELINRPDFASLPGGLLAGGAAAELWVPHVGQHLGQLLSELPGRGTSGIGWMALYLVGALSPLLAFAAAHHLTPDWILDRIEPPWSVLGGTVLVVLGAATLLGLHDEVIAQLTEWSLQTPPSP